MLPIIPGLIRRVLVLVTQEVYQQMQIKGEKKKKVELKSSKLIFITPDTPNHTNEAITQK